MMIEERGVGASLDINNVKIGQDGDFLSYSLPHFYEHNPSRRRKTRLPDDSEKVHYGLIFDGKGHHVELWPNHDFISPGMMIEEREPGHQ
jgi:hypothetical protein